MWHVACGIQETLSTKANQHRTFGHFEKAIVHFHQNLAKHLEEKNSQCLLHSPAHYYMFSLIRFNNVYF